MNRLLFDLMAPLVQAALMANQAYNRQNSAAPDALVEKDDDPFHIAVQHVSREMGAVLGLARRLRSDETASLSGEAKQWAESLFMHAEDLREALKRLASVAPKANEARKDANGEAGAQSPLRVLYVEDNPLEAKMMQQIVERRLGGIVEVAPTICAGFDRARRCRPDLVIVDLNLPDGSGRELAYRLQEVPELIGVPIIALTGDAQARRHNFGSAFWMVLTKPLKIEELVNTIGWVLPRGQIRLTGEIQRETA